MTFWRRNDNQAMTATVCAFLVAAGGAAAMRAAKQQGEPGGGLARAVLTDKEAFLLAPTELIAGNEAGQIFPSPNGRYVLVTRTRQDVPARITIQDLGQFGEPTTPPETSVILWDSQTRKSSVVWKAGGGSLAGQWTTGTLQQAAWLPGTANALLTVSTARGTSGAGEPDSRASLLLYSAATGVTRTLMTMNTTGDREGFMAQVSRTQPVAAIDVVNAENPETQSEGPLTETVRALRPNGTLGPAVRLPERTFLTGFSRDGMQIYFATYSAYNKETKKREPPTYAALNVNSTSGALVPLDKQPQVVAGQSDESDEAVPISGAGDAALPVRLAAAPATLTRAQSHQNVRPVWLERADEPATPPPPAPVATNKPALAKTTPAQLLAADSEPPRALVTADCDDVRLAANGANVNGALLLPGASAILYRAGGALYAVPVLRMDKATFLEARRRAQRMVLISNARQIGTGLMMYVQDYDEIYPSGENFNDKVGPYIKNDSVFQNFVYTFGVRSLADIDNPAELIIGYVTGPGGRANIYADGHVKWQDD